MRTVKVGLDLESAPYIAGAKGATKATDELGDELAETAAKGEALEEAAEDLGEALEDVKTDADRAGEAIDDMGDAARRAARHVNTLDSEIAEARRELAALSEEWVRADEASRVDLTKGISALESKLRDLKKNRSIQEALLPEIKPADVAEFVGKFGDTITSTVKGSPRLGQAGIAIAAGIAATAAPMIGGVIAGAIVGGIGLGGIIGGVALAAQNPVIKAKGKEIGKEFLAGLKEEADEAFSGPLMDVLGDLEDAAARAVPKIGKVFDNVAPSLDDFTGSVIGAGEALLDSFVTASGQSEEPLRALGDLVESVAGSIGEMITDLSDNADEGADAIRNLATVLDWAVEGTTALIEVLSWASGIMNAHFDQWTAAKYAIEDLIPGLDLTADGFKAGSAEALAYRKEQAGVADATDEAVLAAARGASATADLAEEHSAAARAADGQRQALVDLSAEMESELDPVSDLLDAQQKLTDAQKASTKAIKEHGEGSDEAEKATRDLAKAAIDLQGKAGALGDTFDGKLSAGMRATLRAAGLTERQINDLERQFREAKGAADGLAGRLKNGITIPGLLKSTKDVQKLREEINKVRGKTVAINVRVSQRGEILYGNQAPSDMAEGGPVLGPGPKGVDSEIRRLAPGEHVWTAAEVDAAGGHRAVEGMRADVLSGGASPAAVSRVMPASAVQRVVVDVRGGIDLSRADNTAFGQLLANTLRTNSAIRAQVRTELAKT